MYNGFIVKIHFITIFCTLKVAAELHIYMSCFLEINWLDRILETSLFKSTVHRRYQLKGNPWESLYNKLTHAEEDKLNLR